MPITVETVQGESFKAECPIAESDTPATIEARVRQIGAEAVSPIFGRGTELSTISIQFYNSESKCMVEVDDETAVAAMKVASSWRVLVLGFYTRKSSGIKCKVSGIKSPV